MDSDISPLVQRTFAALAAALDDTFSLKLLQELIQLTRGKSLRWVEAALPVAVSGCCLALRDVDLICLRAGLDSYLKQMTSLHELAHLLLGHVPLYADGEGTRTSQDIHETTSNRSLPDAPTMLDLRSLVLVTGYEAEQEYDAEMLATLLYERIEQQQAMVPLSARHLHG